MKANAEEIVDLIFRCIRAGLPPMITSSPGVGKSDIVKQIAKTHNLELIDIRLSTLDPVDMSGLPSIKKDIATWIPMDVFPLESTPIPKGKVGWLIFLDEFNSAPLAMQAASYRLMLDKEVGQHKLHKNVALVGAGNLQTDGAIVNRMSTAMQSRLIHLELAVEIKPWLKWAVKNKVDHRVIAYLNDVPKNLHTFDPKHDDKTFGCPRTWHFLSQLIKDVPTNKLKDLLVLLAGTVGQGVAYEFIGYSSVYSDMASYEEIVKNPYNISIPTEPATLNAYAYMLGAKIDKKDITPIMGFLDKLPPEFRTIAMQNILVTDPTIIQLPKVQTWYTDLGVSSL